MKKILLILLLSTIIEPANADGWKIEASNGCGQYVRIFGKDDYYFCGAHETRCGSDWAEQSELDKGFIHWYTKGESVTMGNKKYWCCKGEVKKRPTQKKTSATGTAGYWVENDAEAFTVTTPLTKKIAGGTCSYNKYENVCGEEYDNFDEVCKDKMNENLECPSGQTLRVTSTGNKSCAPVCEPGYAYESITSNRCVECQETSTQGIVHDAGSTDPDDLANPMQQICRKCNAASQFFDAATRTCKNKNDKKVIALSMTDLRYGKGKQKQSKVADNCWTKFNDEYKDCVLNNK